LGDGADSIWVQPPEEQQAAEAAAPEAAAEAATAVPASIKRELGLVLSPGRKPPKKYRARAKVWSDCFEGLESDNPETMPDC
jgi:hypothetical protein